MSNDLEAREVVSVRDGPNGHDLGIREHAEYKSCLKTRGAGELFSAAHDEIKRRLDLEALEPGTVLATIEYDLDAWTYEIEWHVPVTKLGKLQAWAQRQLTRQIKRKQS